VSGSRTIQVIKRDGSEEQFDLAKLTASIWAPMRAGPGRYLHATELAKAVQAYIERIGWPAVSTAAIFEMTLKVLLRVDYNDAANAYETAHQARKARRKQFRVVHANGRVTMWDKSWLAKVACGSWRLSPRAARILAGQVEAKLLCGSARWASREDIVDMLNELVAEFGLADAVPVGGASPEL